MSSGTKYHWQLLRAGPLKLDGGGMFGVIPRVVWSKSVTPDELNRVTVAHNCILLSQPESSDHILIETGSGDKLDAKMKQIFGLEDRAIEQAILETGSTCAQIAHVIVSHLHFDHAGGLTRRVRPGEKADWSSGETSVMLTFPGADIIVQKREWNDAIANNSVMTRTYYRDHLDPIRDRVTCFDSPKPFGRGHVPARDAMPTAPLRNRMTEVLPGIFVFRVPGHTWGQQAILFTDDRNQIIVFTPDVMPTVHHVGPAYSLSYDVEPYTSMISRRWFLDEAAKNDWLLVLDHEPGNPLQRVRADGKGWYKLIAEDR